MAILFAAASVLCVLTAPSARADGIAYWEHVKGPGYVERSQTIGRSAQGRPITAYYRGYRDAPHVLLVLGQMHGDESAGRRTAGFVRDHVVARPGTGIWVIPSLNPDGHVRHTRTNARGVDLNRNWPTSGWTGSRKGTRYWGGPAPGSEPETKALMAFLRTARPDYIASIHQPLNGIGVSGRDPAWERRLSRALGLPRKSFGVGNPTGTVSPTMTGWYDSTLGEHGVATTIEYAARASTGFATRAALGIVSAAGVI